MFWGTLHLPTLASAEEIENLIQKLNSPQRSVRISAEKSLIATGEEGLLVIEEQLGIDSEFSFQLQRIANTIREQIASASLLGTRISIGGDETSTIHQVIEEIVEQTGFQVRVIDDSKQTPVMISAQEIPFWKGIDLLGSQANVGWQILNGKEIVFNPDFQLRPGATAYPKSLRVAAIQARLKQSLLRVNFRVDAEPDVNPYYLKIRDQDFRLIDSVSSPMNLIPPFNRDAAREITIGDQAGFEFHVDFQMDEEIETDSLTLNGKVEIVCAAHTREAIISLEKNGQTDPQVAVINSKQTRNRLKLLARIRLPEELASFDSHRITLLHKEAWLSLKNDQRIAPQSKKIVRTAGGTHDVEFFFEVAQDLTPDAHFVYAHPSHVMTSTAEFEIQDFSYNSSSTTD